MERAKPTVRMVVCEDCRNGDCDSCYESDCPCNLTDTKFYTRKKRPARKTGRYRAVESSSPGTSRPMRS
jgi:hypothetical protein